jgi:hypothetical protein
MSSVGALIWPRIGAGLERSSSAVVAVSGVPVVAIFRYAAQTSAAKRPHAGFAAATGAAAAGTAPPAPRGAEPLPKNSPAQFFLKTPGAVTPAADCGKKARPRSFQVISGTIASTRGSWAASSSASAPPYEPPTTPTRGSPVASVCTRGWAASQSSSRCASLTS